MEMILINIFTYQSQDLTPTFKNKKVAIHDTNIQVLDPTQKHTQHRQHHITSNPLDPTSNNGVTFSFHSLGWKNIFSFINSIGTYTRSKRNVYTDIFVKSVILTTQDYIFHYRDLLTYQRNIFYSEIGRCELLKYITQ